MLTYAVIVFAIGALGGLVLASSVLRGRLAPWGLSLLHAALGAIGLILVIYAVASGGVPQAALFALAILIIAALGGFYLASIHRRGGGRLPDPAGHRHRRVLSGKRAVRCDSSVTPFIRCSSTFRSYYGP